MNNPIQYIGSAWLYLWAWVKHTYRSYRETSDHMEMVRMDSIADSMAQNQRTLDTIDDTINSWREANVVNASDLVAADAQWRRDNSAMTSFEEKFRREVQYGLDVRNEQGAVRVTRDAAGVERYTPIPLASHAFQPPVARAPVVSLDVLIGTERAIQA